MLLVRLCAETLTQSRRAPKNLVDERLVHDTDERSAGLLRAVEASTFDERDAHELEVLVVDDRDHDRDFLLLAVEQDGTTLIAEAHSPSWIDVDRLVLHRNGEAIETVDGTTATFDLPTDDDAWYVVIAEGDTAMAPLSNDTPWAMSRVVKIDVAGDGWTPPLPPLVE